MAHDDDYDRPNFRGYGSSARQRWPRWKRLLLLSVVLSIAALVGFLLLWNTFFVYVKPGMHLVTIAKKGAPLGPNQVLADEGQEGVQRTVRGEGWHFVMPVIYATERHPNTVIQPGQVGIVTARGGEPLPGNQGLAEEGQRGIQRQVLTPGEYRINTYGYNVEVVKAVEIPPGFVGVLRRLLTMPGKEKGIVRDDILQPGISCINLKEFEVITVEIGIYQTTFKYDVDPRKSTAIKFTSKGGFDISMDCTVEWEVLPQDMPGLVAEYGAHQKVEENVIKTQAHAIGRDKGIDYGVEQLLQGTDREKFQTDFTRELIKKCSVKNVAVRSAFIRDIVIPEEYLKPIREKQIAAETELSNQAKQATAKLLAAVETERQLVDQHVADVTAETARLVASKNQARENITSKTESELEQLRANMQAEIAMKEAGRVRLLGEAQAEVTKLKETAKNSLYQLKMEVFQQDPNAFLRYTLADTLNPKLSLRLMHSGPGTFWTNMDGKGFNLFLPAPGAEKKEEKPK